MTLSEDSFSEILSESMSGAPGGAGADDYLLTPALSQRVDLIRHLIDFSRQILLVIGEEGSGKTSLLRHLGASAPENWRVATLTADPMGGAAVVIDTLAVTFGLQTDPDDDFEQRVQGILNYLQGAREAQLVPAIFVDDAHLLPADALLLLLGLAQPENESANLRVVLFCDPRIERMLGSPQLQAFKQSILHTVEMPPFTEDDTASFLMRFTPGGEAPDEAVVRDLHSRSGGVPGRLRSLAETGLDSEDKAKEEGGDTSPRIQIRYAAAGAAVALLVGAVLWAWHQSDRAPPGKQVVQPAPVTQPTVSVTAPAVSPPVTSSPPAPEPAPQAAESKSESAPAAPPPAPAKAEAPPPAPEPAPAVEPPPAPKPVEKAAESKPKPPAPAKKAEAQATALKGRSWILKQPASHYALQLFGSHEHSAAVNFANTYKLTPRSAIYSTVLDGKAFHVVIYGSYRNRAEAAAAVAGLPPQVRILKPFPRSFADIRKLMARKP